MIRTRQICSALTLVLVTLMTQMAAAQEAPPTPKWDAFPEIAAHQKVGIKARYDTPRYNELRKCVRRFKSKKGAHYYAALVDVTDIDGKRGRGDDDAQPYAKALFEDWITTRKLNPEKAIVVVTGIRNRSVGVWAGTKWQKLGLDDQAIRDAAAASDYLYWVKRYDIGQGLCSVLSAVDFKLVNLTRDLKRRAASAKEELPGVEEDLTTIQTQVAEVFPAAHSYGDGLKAKLAEAAKSIEEAKEKLDDQPSDAVLLFDGARATIKTVGADLSAYKESMESLTLAEKTLATLKDNAETREDRESAFPKAARETLAECEEKATKKRETFAGEVAEVQDCLRRAESELAQGDIHHHYTAKVIPEQRMVVAVVSVLLILLALFLRRRNALSILDPDLKNWERQLSEAQAQLADISERFTTYLVPRDTWQGEVGELDRSTISALNRAFLLHAKGSDLFTRAKNLRKASKIDFFLLDRANKILRKRPVEFAPGEQAGPCPVRLEGAEGYSSNASMLLGDLATSLAEARRLLEEVAVHVQTLDEDSARGELAARAATQALELRRSLDLPVEHLESELSSAIAEFRHGQQESTVNPIHAAKEFEHAAETLVVLEEKIDLGNTVVRQIRGPVMEFGGQLRNVLRKLERDEPIQEPGFDPNALLDALSSSVDFVIGLVNQGEEEQAFREMEKVRARLQELHLQMQARVEAPVLVPLMIAEMTRRRAEFKANGLKIRMAIQKASPEIQKANADNLDQIAAYQNKMSKVARIVTQIQASMEQGNHLAAMAETIRTLKPFMDGVELLDRMVKTVEVQGTTPSRPLPQQWVESAASKWEPDDFGVQRRATGRF